ILGFTIETFVADLLVKRTAAELSERLLGYKLPSDAQEVIGSIVTATRVYRGHRKTYSIEQNGNDRVLVHITVDYVVVKNGSITDSYKPRLEEEAVYDPRFESLTYGKFHLTDLTPSRDEKTRVVTFEPLESVQIRPSRATDSLEGLSSDQRCDVHWKYTLT